MASSQTCGTNIAHVYVPLLTCYIPNETATTVKTYYQAARAAASAVETAIHKAQLILPSSGWTSILCIKESENERRDDEGTRIIEQTYHIIAYKTDTP